MGIVQKIVLVVVYGFQFLNRGCSMNSTKDLILKLKAVREEKGYSFNDIMKIMEDNGDYPLAKSTLSRVFAEGSEENSFRYEETIRPIAKALLDIEEIEDDDNIDTKAMKSLLKYKIQRIEELEQQIKEVKLELAEEKVKRHEKIDALQEEYQRKSDFLSKQIALKDQRIDVLLDSNKGLLDHILNCPYKQNCE